MISDIEIMSNKTKKTKPLFVSRTKKMSLLTEDNKNSEIETVIKEEDDFFIPGLTNEDYKHVENQEEEEKQILTIKNNQLVVDKENLQELLLKPQRNFDPSLRYKKTMDNIADKTKVSEDKEFRILKIVPTKNLRSENGESDQKETKVIDITKSYLKSVKQHDYIKSDYIEGETNQILLRTKGVKDRGTGFLNRDLASYAIYAFEGRKMNEVEINDLADRISGEELPPFYRDCIAKNFQIKESVLKEVSDFNYKKAQALIKQYNFKGYIEDHATYVETQTPPIKVFGRDDNITIRFPVVRAYIANSRINYGNRSYNFVKPEITKFLQPNDMQNIKMKFRFGSFDEQIIKKGYPEFLDEASKVLSNLRYNAGRPIDVFIRLEELYKTQNKVLLGMANYMFVSTLCKQSPSLAVNLGIEYISGKTKCSDHIEKIVEVMYHYNEIYDKDAFLLNEAAKVTETLNRITVSFRDELTQADFNTIFNESLKYDPILTERLAYPPDPSAYIDSYLVSANADIERVFSVNTDARPMLFSSVKQDKFALDTIANSYYILKLYSEILDKDPNNKIKTPFFLNKITIERLPGSQSADIEDNISSEEILEAYMYSAGIKTKFEPMEVYKKVGEELKLKPARLFFPVNLPAYYPLIFFYKNFFHRIPNALTNNRINLFGLSNSDGGYSRVLTSWLRTKVTYLAHFSDNIYVISPNFVASIDISRMEANSTLKFQSSFSEYMIRRVCKAEEAEFFVSYSNKLFSRYKTGVFSPNGKELVSIPLFNLLSGQVGTTEFNHALTGFFIYFLEVNGFSSDKVIDGDKLSEEFFNVCDDFGLVPRLESLVKIPEILTNGDLYAFDLLGYDGVIVDAEKRIAMPVLNKNRLMKALVTEKFNSTDYTIDMLNPYVLGVSGNNIQRANEVALAKKFVETLVMFLKYKNLYYSGGWYYPEICPTLELLLVERGYTLKQMYSFSSKTELDLLYYINEACSQNLNTAVNELSYFFVPSLEDVFNQSLQPGTDLSGLAPYINRQDESFRKIRALEGSLKDFEPFLSLNNIMLSKRQPKYKMLNTGLRYAVDVDYYRNSLDLNQLPNAFLESARVGLNAIKIFSLTSPGSEIFRRHKLRFKEELFSYYSKDIAHLESRQLSGEEPKDINYRMKGSLSFGLVLKNFILRFMSERNAEGTQILLGTIIPDEENRRTYKDLINLYETIISPYVDNIKNLYETLIKKDLEKKVSKDSNFKGTKKSIKKNVRKTFNIQAKNMSVKSSFNLQLFLDAFATPEDWIAIDNTKGFKIPFFRVMKRLFLPKIALIDFVDKLYASVFRTDAYCDVTQYGKEGEIVKKETVPYIDVVEVFLKDYISVLYRKGKYDSMSLVYKMQMEKLKEVNLYPAQLGKIKVKFSYMDFVDQICKTFEEFLPQNLKGVDKFAKMALIEEFIDSQKLNKDLAYAPGPNSETKSRLRLEGVYDLWLTPYFCYAGLFSENSPLSVPLCGLSLKAFYFISGLTVLGSAAQKLSKFFFFLASTYSKSRPLIENFVNKSTCSFEVVYTGVSMLTFYSSSIKYKKLKDNIIKLTQKAKEAKPELFKTLSGFARLFKDFKKLKSDSKSYKELLHNSEPEVIEKEKPEEIEGNLEQAMMKIPKEALLDKSETMTSKRQENPVKNEYDKKETNVLVVCVDKEGFKLKDSRSILSLDVMELFDSVCGFVSRFARDKGCKLRDVYDVLNYFDMNDEEFLKISLKNECSCGGSLLSILCSYFYAKMLKEKKTYERPCFCNFAHIIAISLTKDLGSLFYKDSFMKKIGEELYNYQIKMTPGRFLSWNLEVDRFFSLKPDEYILTNIDYLARIFYKSLFSTCSYIDFYYNENSPLFKERTFEIMRDVACDLVGGLILRNCVFVSYKFFGTDSWRYSLYFDKTYIPEGADMLESSIVVD